MMLPFRAKIKVRYVVLCVLLLCLACFLIAYSGILGSGYELAIINAKEKLYADGETDAGTKNAIISNQTREKNMIRRGNYNDNVTKKWENKQNTETVQVTNITLFDPTESKITYYIDDKDISFAKSQINESRGRDTYWAKGFPLTPEDAIRRYGHLLPFWERYEILHYPIVYYLGIRANKSQLTRNISNNFGFDHEVYDKQLLGQPYKVVVGDHIGYRYEIVKYLSYGGFGIVVLARDWSSPTSRNVAIKIRHIPRKRKFLHREVKLMKHITKFASNIDYFSRMISSFKFRNHVCYVFDLLGNPLDDPFEGPIRNMSLFRRFADDILHGLFYLHELNVVHADLKLDNIMYIYGKDKKSEGQLLKIADFGVGCIPDNTDYHCSSYPVQNMYYRAPEVLFGLPVTPQVDMFSVGVILANLYFGVFPFVGETEAGQLAAMMEVLGLPPTYMIANSSKKEIYSDAICYTTNKGLRRRPYRLMLTNFRKNMDPALFDLIARSLEYDPKLRITAAEALRHPFVTGVYPATGFSEPILIQRLYGKV